MMEPAATYDVVITGGGLAGLSLSVVLAQKGYDVLLVEKEQYPFHRVCGEYLSRESENFLAAIGIDLAALGAVPVTKLELSTGKGRSLEHILPLGGYGISRYLLDQQLANVARERGVTILEKTKTTDITEAGGLFFTETSAGIFRSRLACGSFGKRSNLDISWQRPFIKGTRQPLNNYIGVKYHIEGDFPVDTVSLHLFRKGYAGLVAIEKGRYNFCYLSAADNLKASGNSIERMEKEILSRNPSIRDILARARKTDPRPVTISQVSFEKKQQVERDMLMLGDAAGLIAPLCGNGMSMALHSSKISAELMDSYLQGRTGRKEMDTGYARAWEKVFSARLLTGRLLQSALSKPLFATAMVRVGTLFPEVIHQLIRRTHGKVF